MEKTEKARKFKTFKSFYTEIVVPLKKANPEWYGLMEKQGMVPE
jgi:hypothetical protein